MELLRSRALIGGDRPSPQVFIRRAIVRGDAPSASAIAFVDGLGSSVAPARPTGAKDIRGAAQNVSATIESNAGTRTFAMVFSPFDRRSPASRISTTKDDCLLVGQCSLAQKPLQHDASLLLGRTVSTRRHRMSLIASSAGCFSDPDFCLIFAPCGHDDSDIRPTGKPRCVSKALRRKDAATVRST